MGEEAAAQGAESKDASMRATFVDVVVDVPRHARGDDWIAEFAFAARARSQICEERAHTELYPERSGILQRAGRVSDGKS
jgi:hypothetical protein